MELNFYETLSEATQALKSRAYVDEFKFVEGKLLNASTRTSYVPDELMIREYHRFIDEAKAERTKVLFAIRTKDNRKGMLVMDYSVDAEMGLINFMNRVRIHIPDGDEDKK